MKVRPFHHQRPLVAAAAAYGVGVWAGVSFAWRPWAYALGLALALLMTAALPGDGRKRHGGWILSALFLGMLLGGYAAHPILPEAGQYRVTGVLAADMTLREDGTAAGYLEKVEMENEAGTSRLGRVYWTYSPSGDAETLPREGDRVTFDGKMYHPSGRENPYGFDFRMYLLEKGVPAGISGARELTVTGRESRGAAGLTYRARAWLSRRIDAVFGADGDLPKALLIGQRSDLPQETVQGFTDAGAAHVLAVSGLHVALLAGVLMAPLRRLLKPKGRFFALAAFLLCYCALLDFSAPVVRASILLTVSAGRRTVRRAGDRLTALAFAFLLILLVRPLDLFSPSFQLSFGTVLGIVAMQPWLERVLPRRLEKTVGITLAATAGAAIPTAQIFHRVSLIGILINPVVCAVFSLLLPAYFLVLAVGCLWLPGGVFLANWVNAASRAVVQGIRTLGDLPFATVRVPSLPWYCVMALIFAFALATRYAVWPGRRKAALAAAALFFSFGTWRLTVNRNVQYVQLSVGQADSALILDGEKTAVIDVGEYGGDTAAYLLSTGRQADCLILTHLHMDHCGGLRQLMDQRLPIGAVYLPEGAEEQAVDERALALLNELRRLGVPILHVKAGDEIKLPRSSLAVTWPEGGRVLPGRDANRYSLCMLCDLDGVKLLHCGDLTGDYELYAARDADILKVAHHGSKTSTGLDFLQAVTPQIALISTYAGNAYLPYGDTLERLREAGAEIFLTGETGAVTVTAKQGKAQVTTYLLPKEQP